MEEALSLRAGLDLFITIHMPARNLSPRTREEYSRDLYDFISFLERQSVVECSQVNLTHLDSFMAELDRRGLKPSTRKRKAFSVKTFFSFLEQHGHIDYNPAVRLIPPELPKREPRFLSDEEYNTLLAQVTNVRDRAIVMLFLQTGMRLSELVGLNLEHVELPRRVTRDPADVGIVRVTRKRSKVETLPVNWKACEALKIWFLERERLSRSKNISTTAVFITKFGERMSQRSIQQMLQKYLKQAGIHGASVHTLRHTMATHYLAKGGDVRSVQQMLGHASLETTQLYVSLAKKVQRKMVQELAL